MRDNNYLASQLGGLLHPLVGSLGVLVVGLFILHRDPRLERALGDQAVEARLSRFIQRGEAVKGERLNVHVTLLRFSHKINAMDKENDVIKTLYKAWPPEPDLNS